MNDTAIQVTGSYVLNNQRLEKENEISTMA